MAIPVILGALGVLILRVVTSPAGRVIIREGIRRIPQAPIPKAPPRPPILGPKTQPPKTTTAPAPAPVTPPVPLPAPQPNKGNTRPVGHDGKEDDKNCKKELEKYPVHAYGERDETQNRLDNKQSHHVVQHALFMNQDGAMPSSLAPVPCDSYTHSAAPCIALVGGTKQPNSPHGKATSMQSKHNTQARASGKPYTYGTARENTKKQLEAAELSEKEIKCVMAVVEAWISGLCPNINDSTIMRTPGLRNKL